jgi:hypothetical protein
MTKDELKRVANLIGEARMIIRLAKSGAAGAERYLTDAMENSLAGVAGIVTTLTKEHGGKRYDEARNRRLLHALNYGRGDR